ncbi:MAG TPA: triacylglycerol lipase [Myxococcota bacterium]|jgi:hypothetical protein|nr:triacylglycerol lipase [Myxococcota bacterium]
MTAPRRVYLVPGFFGFANLGELRYFGHTRAFLARALADLGVEARVEAVPTPPTASLPRRAAFLLERLAADDAAAPPPGAGAGGDGGAGTRIDLVGHSSGGLDARLLVSPDVSLPGAVAAAPFAARVGAIVTVATPHRGTPLASFFTSLLGQRLLQLLSLTTITALRVGHVPLAVLLKLGGLFARLDDLLLNSALLDQLFDQLLEDFSPERRAALDRFFADVSADTSLLPQLTPESMEVFNASTRDRPGVRYGCVVTRGRRPGVGSTISAGLDPGAQATHALYVALHGLAGGTPPERVAAVLRGPTGDALAAAYGGERVDCVDNDGVVPTLAQPWGELLQAVRGDHLDVIGHFNDPGHEPPHVDWIATGSGFDRAQFEAVWRAVARFLAQDG